MSAGKKIEINDVTVAVEDRHRRPPSCRHGFAEQSLVDAVFLLEGEWSAKRAGNHRFSDLRGVVLRTFIGTSSIAWAPARAVNARCQPRA